MKFYVISLLGFLVLFSCRKDPPTDAYVTVESNNESFCGFECAEFPKSNSIFGYETYSDGPQYLTPTFNPTNDQEFIYVRVNEDWGDAELVKVNLNDMSETIILNSVYVRSEPVWNTDGWIVFSATNNKIWKIKDDGTNLTQLTFGPSDTHPNFNFDGSLIFYKREIGYSNAELEDNPELYKNSKIIVINLEGVAVDSVLTPDIRNKPDRPFLFQLWSQADLTEDRVYFSWGVDDNYGIYALDLTTNEIVIVDQWNRGHNNYQLVTNVKYHDGFVYLSKFRNNLLRINVNTGENEHIICGCDQNHYNSLSISPSGDKILVDRIISTVLNDEEIDEQHEIWMLNIDGSTAVKILGDPE